MLGYIYFISYIDARYAVLKEFHSIIMGNGVDDIYELKLN